MTLSTDYYRQSMQLQGDLCTSEKIVLQLTDSVTWMQEINKGAAFLGIIFSLGNLLQGKVRSSRALSRFTLITGSTLFVLTASRSVLEPVARDIIKGLKTKRPSTTLQ